MGSNVPFKIKVLKLVEDEVEVYALTSRDAIHEAEQIPGVAMVVRVIYDEEEK